MDVLSNHQARTDHPEGHGHGDDTPQATSDHTPATKPDGKDAPKGDAKPADGKPGDDAAKTAQAEAAAAALAINPAATPAVAVSIADAPAAAAAATGTAVTAAPAAAVAALASQAQAGQAVPGQAVPGQPVPGQPVAQDPKAIAKPGDTPAQAGVPVPATPVVDPAQAQAQAAAAQPQPAAQAEVKPPVAPAAAQPQPVAPQAPQPQADAASAAPVVPAAATPQPGADQGQDAGAQGQPQPQQAPGVPPVGLQPVTVQHTPASAGVAYVAHQTPLNTAETVERIHGLVELANANGTAQARIDLHPAELGGVTIQLKVTASGLQAHIAADRPDALPLLQQAGDDLRKALVDRGVEVNHLDFGMQGGSEAGAWRDQSRAQQELAGDFRGTGPEAADDLLVTDVATPTVETPAGALVDVKA